MNEEKEKKNCNLCSISSRTTRLMLKTLIFIHLFSFILNYATKWIISKEPPYIECVATGWGMSYENGEKLSDKLVKTRVLIFDNDR